MREAKKGLIVCNISEAILTWNAHVVSFVFADKITVKANDERSRQESLPFTVYRKIEMSPFRQIIVKGIQTSRHDYYFLFFLPFA